MFHLIREPWPWYVAGVLVGLTVPALLLLGNKSFGISSSLRHICAACLPAGIPFFQYNWRKEVWNLFFVAGIALGGFIATQWLNNPEPVHVAEPTAQALQHLGVIVDGNLMPASIFSFSNLFTLKGLVFFVIGGFLIGFERGMRAAVQAGMLSWGYRPCNGLRSWLRVVLWRAAFLWFTSFFRGCCPYFDF